ncbi:hypothetical protein BH23GEM10_BH23GEM10_04350 [soil metagenome]
MRRIMVIAAALICGCNPAVPLAEVEPGAGSPPELGSSFNVHVEDGAVHLELHVTNVTSGPLVLEFGTSQRYDFAVDHLNGEGAFRWSAARSFARVLGTEELAAGESRRYTASWAAPRSGDYVATAWLVSSDHPVELRTVFRVPDEWVPDE